MMTDILEIPDVRRRVSPLSVEEYHQLGELNENGRRTELIRGIIIEKMSKSPLHSLVTSRLFRRLLGLLPPGFSIWKDEPLTFAELVVEVSVSSPDLDRANAALYAEAGIKEYWIILALERRVEVYRQPSQGRYQEMFTCGPDDTLECTCLPGVRARVSELFV
jgi:Uma2 family endonuclease